MEHKKYESISGAWNKKFTDYLEATSFVRHDVEWVLTEKIHGSNFSFYMSQDEEKCGKRNGFLKEGENFFQSNRMREREEYKVRELWDFLAQGDNGLTEIIVYGELCGGNYPHPDIQRPKTVKAIQKGVYYAPDIEFVVFDIIVNGKYLNFAQTVILCQKVGLNCVQPLKVGSYYDLRQHTNEFPSTIYEYFRLPQIENNICEGFVMKPIEAREFTTGDRVIIKDKNDKFKEIERAPKKQRKVDNTLSEYSMETLALIEPYINDNRLNSVLSKHGEIHKSDFNDVLKAFKEDIYIDFKKNYDNLEWISDDDFRIFDKSLTRKCIEVWKPVYLSDREWRKDKKNKKGKK